MQFSWMKIPRLCKCKLMKLKIYFRVRPKNIFPMKRQLISSWMTSNFRRDYSFIDKEVILLYKNLGNAFIILHRDHVNLESILVMRNTTLRWSLSMRNTYVKQETTTFYFVLLKIQSAILTTTCIPRILSMIEKRTSIWPHLFDVCCSD